MKWRSNKTTTDGGKEGESDTDTTNTTPTEPSTKEGKHKKSKFLSGLWKSKPSTATPAAVDEQEEGEDDEKATENKDGVVVTDPDTKNSEAEKKKRWPNLWGSTKNEEEEEASDDIEVVVDKTDDTLQIHHQSSRNSFASSHNGDRPSVHEESLEMLTASLLIYIFADLREMARQGKIDAGDLLQTPVTVRQVVGAIKNHRQALEERAINHEDIEGKLTAIRETIQPTQEESQTNLSQEEELATPEQPTETTPICDMMRKFLRGNSSSSTSLSSSSSSSSLSALKEKESVLAHYHDETTTQGVVYGIAINHVKKRVTVIFRGSVTQQDFMTDAKSRQKTVTNPVLSLPTTSSDSKSSTTSLSDKVNIHTGFYQYLFRKDNVGKVTLEHILEDVKQLIREHPGYRVYCTGHSLGGALSTLCGFYASLEEELIQNGPIVVYSIASPQVGNSKFCDAFHELERQNRVQHLRISNREDMITHLPFVAIKSTAFSPLLTVFRGAGNLYKHCGLHLELKSMMTVQQQPDAEGNEDTETTSQRSKHYSLCHQKGQCEKEFSYTEEFKRSMEAAKMLVESMTPMAKVDFDALTNHHSCREYEARLMATQEYLATLTLDALYKDESIVGKSLSQ